MSDCALHPNGQLKDASEIQWFNDPDPSSLHPLKHRSIQYPMISRIAKDYLAI
ncbi:hypothetical protein K503DRAFT_775555 [Rhizopogon vinicolor AM-OR11-026]|uniref:HAT C-terminal dimerisation domain-containing protein n=1 Tax=Rhizopogon vinicolor AM-OR11-026 TaxID=1314800 RepID=A0A1B7MLL6_9AGAM|nr:hypothetical protein K503DRAFT_775718 [Rhizopogon vinicolor AM-OR11-026]OAX33482.1 hypothetical protein K503DRAFT_775555 [Rhizopogon vinicolor AM-OR11-026]